MSWSSSSRVSWTLPVTSYTRNSSGKARLSGNPEQCIGKSFIAETVVGITFPMSTRLASGSVSVLTAHRSSPHAAAGVGDGDGDGAGAGLGVGVVGAGAVGDELLPHEAAHSESPSIHARANFMSEPPH